MSRLGFIAAAAALALSACSTIATEGPSGGAPEPAPFSATISIQNVNGSAASGSRAPAGFASALADAVRTELGKAPQAGPAANLTFTISDYRAGGRKPRGKAAKPPTPAAMTVKVSITSPGGVALRQFEVSRTSEPSAGTPADQRAALLAETAEAIVRTAHGEAAS